MSKLSKKSQFAIEFSLKNPKNFLKISIFIVFFRPNAQNFDRWLLNLICLYNVPLICFFSHHFELIITKMSWKINENFQNLLEILRFFIYFLLKFSKFSLPLGGLLPPDPLLERRPTFSHLFTIICQLFENFSFFLVIF